MRGERKRIRRKEQLLRFTVKILLILPFISWIFLAVKVEKLESQIEELKKEKNIPVVSTNDAEIKGKQQEDEINNKSKKVYLTFDDGPGIYTEDILNILRKYDVKATFFVTGMNVPEYNECYQRIVDEGHSLGIHSYSHVYADIYSSLKSFQEDFNKMREHIFQCTGEEVKLYRFPGGSANNILSSRGRKQIMQWLAEEEIIYFDWNVDSGDSEKDMLSPEEIAEQCISGVQECNTAIVLLHDSAGKKNTVEALPLIIEGIRQLDDTVLLPMDENTVAIQQISYTKE